MPILNWNEELAVGIPEIDEQHKHLIALINQLHDAMSEGRGKQVLSDVLDELIAYTKTHFSHEEKLMAQANYRGLASHKREHDFLTRRVIEFQKRFVAGEIGIAVELSNFLKDWILHHVRGMDKAYAPAIRENLGMQ